jgi:putative membrane-bound dehydrogenase-like protein
MKPALSFQTDTLKSFFLRVPFFALLCGMSAQFISCSPDKSGGPGGEAGNTKGLHVPEGFVIEPATTPGLVSYPMFATLDHQGRLFVIESSGKTTSTEDVLRNPTFKILLLEDVDGDGVYDRRNVYADKIPYPMGGTFYRGSFYTAAPPDLLRFTDTDADGQADKREVLLTGWTLNHNAATLSGPFFGPDGWMYMCDARRGFNITTKEGTQLKGKGARIWRCRPDGTGLESLSGGGFDNSIELIFMPGGETIGTITYFIDPQDGFRDALIHWVEGGVYPKPFPVIEADKLKLTGPLMPPMTKFARVSPAGLMRYRSTSFGDEFHGNLFSAQFNTGRIMRHVISADGATFRTEDEVFMSTDSADVHPTDVLEDGDGSLLVVNTGGWFIAGCPLSVVAKQEIHGDIFRIRKANARRAKDPWGRSLDFENLPVLELSKLMDDSRIFVRENAAEHLIAKGDEATDAFNTLLTASENEETRSAAVFALARIGTGEATKNVLSALEDRSAIVRTAAIRVLGMNKETNAVGQLTDLLKDHSPAVRRQAATALGQAGDFHAIPALLEAAADSGDRFMQHAITFSLITFGQTKPLVAALEHPNPKVRNTALIALDQIDGSQLKKQDLIPFITSENKQLQHTGLWVLAHHRDWADVVVMHIGGNLKNKLASEEEKIFSDLLVTFSPDLQVQNFVAAALASPAKVEAEKIFLLNVMRQYPAQDLPQKWVSQLGHLLKGKNALMRAEVLELIQSRSIPSLNNELDEFISNAEYSNAFRLKALNARIMSQPKLSGTEFNMLVTFTEPGHDAPLRQSAVRILTQAELDDAQLLTLAKETLPEADVFLLPGLVKAFEGNDNEDVARALLESLPVSTDRLDYLSVEDLNRLIKDFSPSVKESAAPIMKTLQTRQATRLSALEKVEATLRPGDVAEGRKLFFGKALCSTCHSIVGQGQTFGPDLTNVGEIRSRHDILEAIVYPSASFAREYETSRIVAGSATYIGIIKEQLGETMVMETGPGVQVRVSQKQITAIEPQDVSLMPPGLHQQLGTQELSNLMAYLTSLPDGMGHLK